MSKRGKREVRKQNRGKQDAFIRHQQITWLLSENENPWRVLGCGGSCPEDHTGGCDGKRWFQRQEWKHYEQAGPCGVPGERGRWLGPGRSGEKWQDSGIF